MPTKRAILALTVASLLFALSVAGKVTLYNKPEGYKDTRGSYVGSITVDVGPAQHCYTLTCFGGMIKAADWSDLQTRAFLLFFSEPGCKGERTKVTPGTDDEIGFYRTLMENNVASVMVWESSVYPTRGILDCTSTLDYERYGVGNNSSVDESTMGVAGSGAYTLNTTRFLSEHI